MTEQKPDATTPALSMLEKKTLARVSRPGPYVGLDGKSVQRLVKLGLVKTLVSGYTLTEEGIAALRG